MTRTPLHIGGCQCGAIRYALYAEPSGVSICHCRMCQKALGNFFGPFAGVKLEDFEWTRGQPKIFHSSDKAKRGFCANCGTPLSFAYVDSGAIDVSIGSLDRPAAVSPRTQIMPADKVTYVDSLADLPSRVIEPRHLDMLEAIKNSNHQHPDHHTLEWQPHEPNL